MFEPGKSTKYRFGIRGGVSFSQLTNTDNNFDKHTGFLVGLYFDTSIYENLVVFQPEVLYKQKGFDVNDYKFRADYIEVPLLFRVNFVNPSGILPFVYFGPNIAFKVNTDFPEALPSEAGNFIDDQVKTTSFGVTVGGGLDFGHLSLGVRYDAGLTKILEDDTNIDAKFGVLSIVAGIGF